MAEDRVVHFRSGTVEVSTFRNHIDVHHNLPPEAWDKAMNIVGRSEVVLSVADFWKNWDEPARRDFAVALTFIAGEMLRTLPLREELTP
jgi:hypothetical protein